jgi:ketosteroid isomerase-like protein
MTESSASDLETLLTALDDPPIAAAERALRTAQLTADVAALDALLSDELLFTGPDGQLSTKAADLAAHRTGAVRFRTHEVAALRVRRVGHDVALVAMHAKLGVEVHGALHTGWFRYTRVWGREDGHNWRVVGGHVAAAPAPPEVAA